ncbi:MAG: dTDP-4-dehydrorhamnose 3,5-epimerase [Bacteroides cellulosilyticus]
MKIINTSITGVIIIEPRLLAMNVAIFLSLSIKKNSKKMFVKRFLYKIMSLNHLTGLFEGYIIKKPPFAQSKLVRVIKGAVLDVAVDIRKGSPTFGHHVAVELTEDNHRQFFIPRGFAHGFSVLSEEVVFQYKCDNFYAPQYEGAIAWDDPDLRIDWRISDNNLILSEKDKSTSKYK